MKIYIAGKITGDPDYKLKFRAACRELSLLGHLIMDPSILPGGFAYEEYMHVCFSMIDTCDAILLLKDWPDSPGAKREMSYAEKTGKKVLHDYEPGRGIQI